MFEPSTPQDTEETYEYTVTLTADGIDPVTADVTITVETRSSPAGSTTPQDLTRHRPLYVDEGAGDLELDATCYAGITSPGGGHTRTSGEVAASRRERRRRF